MCGLFPHTSRQMKQIKEFILNVELPFGSCLSEAIGMRSNDNCDYNCIHMKTLGPR